MFDTGTLTTLTNSGTISGSATGDVGDWCWS